MWNPLPNVILHLNDCLDTILEEQKKTVFKNIVVLPVICCSFLCTCECACYICVVLFKEESVYQVIYSNTYTSTCSHIRLLLCKIIVFLSLWLWPFLRSNCENIELSFLKLRNFILYNWSVLFLILFFNFTQFHFSQLRIFIF